MSDMTSTRPYLIRAFYDWIIDNDCTPYLVVNADFGGVIVPQEYVENGQIVLNIAISAVNSLSLGDRSIEFQARFAGRLFHVFIPILAVIAIYAKENGRGMVFAEEEGEDEGELPLSRDKRSVMGEPERNSNKVKKKSKVSGRPHLTIVK